MNKKLIGAAIGAAALLAVAAPAFADFKVVNKYTDVDNNVTTNANTGFNELHGRNVFGGLISTGDALAASHVSNDVNSTVLLGCGCLDFEFGGAKVINKHTDVDNNVTTNANTGFNELHGRNLGGFEEEALTLGGGSGASILTGGAGAASVVSNTVNTTILGGSL